MTHPVNHLDDDLLSALVDDQLTPTERSQAQLHLGTCSACQERLDELHAVASLLRRLPDLPPPRDFSLGPRLLVDPPNVIRLRRWYAVARVSAGSLAAVFVLLTAGTLYLDARPASSPEIAVLSKPQLASAPAASQSAPTPTSGGPAPTSGGPAPTSGEPAAAPAAAAAVKVAPPAAAPALAPAAAPPATARTVGGANPEPLDQQAAAATSQRALPTPVPTPQPTVASVAPPSTPAFATSAAVDSAAPLRTAAILVGVLAVLTLLATLVVRHRLRQSASHY